MPRLLPILLAALVALPSAAVVEKPEVNSFTPKGVPGSPDESPESKAATAIRARYVALADAYAKKDAKAVASIRAREFTEAVPGGKPLDAAAAEARLAETWSSWTEPSVAFEIGSVKLEGDVATVDEWRALSYLEAGTKRPVDLLSRREAVWVREGAEWKLRSLGEAHEPKPGERAGVPK